MCIEDPGLVFSAIKTSVTHFLGKRPLESSFCTKVFWKVLYSKTSLNGFLYTEEGFSIYRRRAALCRKLLEGLLYIDTFYASFVQKNIGSDSVFSKKKICRESSLHRRSLPCTLFGEHLKMISYASKNIKSLQGQFHMEAFPYLGDYVYRKHFLKNCFT